MATKMFRTRVVILLAFVVGLLLLSSSNSQIFSWPDGQNVLANGSFEDGTGPGGPFKPDGSGVMVVTPGSTTIPSWTVTGAAGVEVAWLRDVNDYVPKGDGFAADRAAQTTTASTQGDRKSDGHNRGIDSVVYVGALASVAPTHPGGRAQSPYCGTWDTRALSPMRRARSSAPGPSVIPC
jgi:hypothetical protein